MEVSKKPPPARVVYWMAALALAAVLLYYSIRGIDWLRVWEALRSANPLFACLALANISAAMFLRALRWRVLLSAEGRVSVPLAFRATAAGYLGNNVLPARAGELIRTLMISRRSGLSRTFVLTTALSERVSDAIVLIGVSAVALLTLSTRPGWLAGAARPFAIVGLCGAAAIALLPVFESVYYKILERLPVPARMRGGLERAIAQVVQGIRSFHERGRLIRFLAFTAVIWCMDAVTVLLCAKSLGFSVGFPVAFLLLAGMGLGSALPSTPGYVGIYQFVAVSVLTPFGFGRSDAIAFSLLLQGIGYVVVLGWGLAAVAIERSAKQEAHAEAT